MHPSTASQTRVEVALPVALHRPLLYVVPPELEERVQPGHRVRVPLRGRETFGFVVGVRRGEAGIGPDAGVKLRPIHSLDPDPVLLDDRLLKLARWVVSG